MRKIFTFKSKNKDKEQKNGKDSQIDKQNDADTVFM